MTTSEQLDETQRKLILAIGDAYHIRPTADRDAMWKELYAVVEQAREALELREALEYLCSAPISSSCGPGHVIKFADGEYGFVHHKGSRDSAKGSTPLEAIQNAMEGKR